MCLKLYEKIFSNTLKCLIVITSVDRLNIHPVYNINYALTFELFFMAILFLLFSENIQIHDFQQFERSAIILLNMKI